MSNPDDGSQGVGGTKSQFVLDNNIPDIPLALHFAPGFSEAHVSAETLQKITGNKVPTGINPLAVSFGTSSNEDSVTHFITTSLGNEPLHTLGREYRISSEPSAGGNEGTVHAAHAVAHPGFWPRATPITHHLQDLSGMHGADHFSASHVTDVSTETAKMQYKTAASWRNSVGASIEDVLHGCITATGKTGEKRFSIPLDASMEADGRGQLSALCERKQDSLRDLLGDHHVTEPLLNPTTGKACPHVVVLESAAMGAAAGLVKNLGKGPCGNGITFSCKNAAGGAPKAAVQVQATLHRMPASVEGKPPLPGAPPVVHATVASAIGGTAEISDSAAASGPGGEAATDALMSAMFDSKVRLRDNSPAKPDQQHGAASPAASMELHGQSASLPEAP